MSFDLKFLPIIRQFWKSIMQHGPGCQSYTSREFAKFSTGQHFGVFGKMPYLRYTPIWSNLGGWRYTKQYIIRRDFHGRLHPKLTLLHAEICRFLTPPKMVFHILAILTILPNCANLHILHICVFCILRHDMLSKCHVDDRDRHHVMITHDVFQKV
jgi:hypothetical protein